MTKAVIIPARYTSKRFPGKSLEKISTKPMIEWVVNNAKGSKLANRVIVATDDTRIYNFVKDKLKVEAYLTLPEHKSGTDRIGEVVRKLSEIEYVVNLQGDEPLIPPEYIDKAFEALLSNPEGEFIMSTLVAPILNSHDLNNPNIVKVVMDKDGYALYFSRAEIPYNREQGLELRAQTEQHKDIETNLKDLDQSIKEELKNTSSKSHSSSPHLSPLTSLFYFQHIGIYGYTREALLKFCRLGESNLEKIERLEQLRALENGIEIKVEKVEKAYQSVDTKEDIKIVEELLKTRKEEIVVN
jgi:3-deoxy-manno-octulosonate cytidylyltransferase (CMP-KDO synthetase)